MNKKAKKIKKSKYNVVRFESYSSSYRIRPHAYIQIVKSLLEFLYWNVTKEERERNSNVFFDRGQVRGVEGYKRRDEECRTMLDSI